MFFQKGKSGRSEKIENVCVSVTQSINRSFATVTSGGLKPDSRRSSRNWTRTDPIRKKPRYDLRLWGKVASAALLLIAAVFAVISIVQPQERTKFATVAILLTAAALFGVPAFVRWFMSFTGDEDILATGILGSATITTLEPTGWRFNNYYPVVRFGLSVEAGGAAYPVEIKQIVDPELLERLASGKVVAVRVDRQDHKKVVIDWREPDPATTDPAGKEPAANQFPAIEFEFGIRHQLEREAAGGGVVTVSATKQTTPSTDQSGKKSIKRYVALGCLLFGLIFLRLSCEEDYYAKGGVRVQGVVVKKTYTPATNLQKGGSSSKHYISYRFTTQEGRTIEGRSDVLLDAWEKAKEGDPVVVEYLADSPSTNRIPEQRASSLTFEIMSALLLIASGVLFIIGWRQRSAQTVDQDV